MKETGLTEKEFREASQAGAIHGKWYLCGWKDQFTGEEYKLWFREEDLELYEEAEA